jgi:rhodanese-related sulfurtransferase
MPRQKNTLLNEMITIIVVAVTLGIIWNHRLLWERYTGKLASSQNIPVLTTAVSKSLQPASLMQVKDFFDGNKAVFIDARERTVFVAGHIKGAVSLPLGELNTRLEGVMAKVSQNTVLVVYCGGFGCPDSKTLGNSLLKKGYQQVLIFEGGYPEWKSAGLPVEGSMP